MVSADTFRSVVGRFASGITIVTVIDENEVDQGMTATAFCSVSLVPPLVLVCIDHAAPMHDVVGRASHFAVNLLSSGQEELSRRFGSEKAQRGGLPEGERFVGVGFVRGATGAALLNDALAHMECRIVDRHEAGDHTIVVGEVETAVTHDARPLLYYRGGYTQLEG
jgi:flavin reductase (DIM6/NTAB) family NADH-FMN oxidoreductase RutF